ncbi:hypothetical protein Anapl_16523 [Anas platyrhynchos]|uniref:Uncharacterized protein n=1 Tax=Anas platyrhynchos TaxID=8839 RepID=R0L3V7_ANAPL|nr:hypothetical protein Anapl_16523 [Anas platyrhynchos]
MRSSWNRRAKQPVEMFSCALMQQTASKVAFVGCFLCFSHFSLKLSLQEMARGSKGLVSKHSYYQKPWGDAGGGAVHLTRVGLAVPTADLMVFLVLAPSAEPDHAQRSAPKLWWWQPVGPPRCHGVHQQGGSPSCAPSAPSPLTGQGPARQGKRSPSVDACQPQPDETRHCLPSEASALLPNTPSKFSMAYSGRPSFLKACSQNAQEKDLDIQVWAKSREGKTSRASLSTKFGSILSCSTQGRELLTWLVKKGGSSKEGEGSGIIAELLFQSRGERAGESEDWAATVCSAAFRNLYKQQAGAAERLSLSARRCLRAALPRGFHGQCRSIPLRLKEEHDPGPSSSHLHEGQFKMTSGMDGREEADWHIKKHVAKAKRRQNLSEPPPDNLSMDHWDPPGRGKRPCG